MFDALEELNKTEAVAIKIGVGLNTGICCVGNLGSEQRFSYSAIGDAVNVSARVEGLTKQYGVRFLMTEMTAANARDLAVLEVDHVRVVGRSEPVAIFTLLGNEAFAGDAGVLGPRGSAWPDAGCLPAPRLRRRGRRTGGSSKARSRSSRVVLRHLREAACLACRKSAGAGLGRRFQRDREIRQPGYASDAVFQAALRCSGERPWLLGRPFLSRFEGSPTQGLAPLLDRLEEIGCGRAPPSAGSRRTKAFPRKGADRARRPGTRPPASGPPAAIFASCGAMLLRRRSCAD